MIYKIPKGKHKSTYKIALTFKDSFRQIVEFKDSCLYVNKNPNNQYDINKLFGISDGLDHHYNSARFGWRCDEGRISIFAYTYVRGERQVKPVAKVDIDTPYNFSILIIDNLYHFLVNGKSTTSQRGGKGKTLKYKLFPYFGGDETAPHDIFIDIS